MTKPKINIQTNNGVIRTIPGGLMPNFATVNPFAFHIPFSGDQNAKTWIDWSLKPNQERNNITISLPSWLPWTNVDSIVIRSNSSGSSPPLTCAANASVNNITDELMNASGPVSCTNGSCCYHYNQNTNLLKIVLASNSAPVIADHQYDYFAEINHLPLPGSLGWEQNNLPLPQHKRSTSTGNFKYYLERLARLELSGIPQITMMPLYCSSNYQKMVPGLFDEIQTISDFIAHANTFIDPDAQTPFQNDIAPGAFNANSLNTQHVATSELLAHDPIFSANDFQCCRNVGSIVTNKNQCCSGYAVDDPGSTTQQTTYICKLPAATNLNVYLNKFVSGEGKDNLADADYETRTGEPKNTTTVLQKIINFGKAHCESGAVRRGGVFGEFEPAPYRRLETAQGGAGFFSITDSMNDYGEGMDIGATMEKGYGPFIQGYRWNHHIYCLGE
jgi:hypothetical protein